MPRQANKKRSKSEFHLSSSKFPWRIGDIVEMKTQEIGYRGAWFRVEINKLRQVKYGKLYSTVIYKDFPDESQEEIVAMNIDPITRRSDLMIRPLPPPAIKESTYDGTGQQNIVHAILRDYWQVGDLVDWWYNDCWWSAEVLVALGEGDFQVRCPSPPEGEGGVYLAKGSDMRASLNWSLEEQWTAPPSKMLGMKQCARLVGTILYPDVGTTEFHEPDELIEHEEHMQKSEDNTEMTNKELVKDDTNKEKDFSEDSPMSRIEHKLHLDTDEQSLTKPLESFRNLENEFEDNKQGISYMEKYSTVNSDENLSEQDSIKCINEEETCEKQRAKTKIQYKHCMIDKIKKEQRKSAKVVGQLDQQLQARIDLEGESTSELATLRCKRPKPLPQKSFNKGEMITKPSIHHESEVLQVCSENLCKAQMKERLMIDEPAEVLGDKITSRSLKKDLRLRTELLMQVPNIRQNKMEKRLLDSVEVRDEQTSRMRILANVGKQDVQQSIIDKKNRKHLQKIVTKESKCAEHTCNNHHRKIIGKEEHFEEKCDEVYKEKIDLSNEVDIQPCKKPKENKKRRLELNMVKEVKSEGVATRQEQVISEAITSMNAGTTIRDFALHEVERDDAKLRIGANQLKLQEAFSIPSEQQKADTTKRAIMKSTSKMEVSNEIAPIKVSSEQDLSILRKSKSKGHVLPIKSCKNPYGTKKSRLELNMIQQVKFDGVGATQEEQVIGEAITSMYVGTTISGFALHEVERDDAELRVGVNQLKVQEDFSKQSEHQKANIAKRATMKSTSKMEVPNEIVPAEAFSEQDPRISRESKSTGHALSLQPSKNPRANKKRHLELNMMHEVKSDGVHTTQDEQVTGETITSTYAKTTVRDVGLQKVERQNHKVFNNAELRICANQLKVQEDFSRWSEHQKANTAKRISKRKVPNEIAQAQASSEQDLRTSRESKSRGHTLSLQPCKNPKRNKTRRLEVNMVQQVKSDVVTATQEEQVTDEAITSMYARTAISDFVLHEVERENQIVFNDVELRICANQLIVQEDLILGSEQQQADIAKRAIMKSISKMEGPNELAQAKASSEQDLRILQQSKSTCHALSLQPRKISKGNKKRQLELNMVQEEKFAGVLATQEEQVTGDAITSMYAGATIRKFSLHEVERDNYKEFVNDNELRICDNQLKVQEDFPRRSKQQRASIIKRATMKSTARMEVPNEIAQAQAPSEDHAPSLLVIDKRLELSGISYRHEKTNDCEGDVLPKDKYVTHDRLSVFPNTHLEKSAHMSTNPIHDPLLEWELEDADKAVNSDDLHISVCGSLASLSEGVCLSSGVHGENVLTNDDIISTDGLDADADSCSVKFICVRERPSQDCVPDLSNRRDLMIDYVLDLSNPPDLMIGPNPAHVVDYSCLRRIIDKPVIKYKSVLSRKLVSNARRELWTKRKPLNKCKTC